MVGEARGSTWGAKLETSCSASSAGGSSARDAGWPGLREWLKPFAQRFTPFDEPGWCRDWRRPIEPKQTAMPAEAPSWMHALHALAHPAAAFRS